MLIVVMKKKLINLIERMKQSMMEKNEKQKVKKKMMEIKQKNMIRMMYVIDEQFIVLIEVFSFIQESVYDVKLEKTFSKMTDDEKRVMIERVRRNKKRFN